MGSYLGQGMPYSVAKRDFMADVTIEGAQLAQAIGPTIEALLAQSRLDPAALPLMTTMINIVTHDAPVEFPWDAFFAGDLAL
jgi:glycerol-3-phosphate dehydrogenase (NAD(P)+)